LAAEKKGFLKNMSNVVQFRRTTAILTLVAASIGGGLVAAFAVVSRSGAPVAVAHADTSNNDRAAAQLSNSFADVIEKASPAVVKISMTRVIKASEQQGGGGGNPLGNDPFFQQFFGGRAPKPHDQREEGLGSGVLMTSSGYILTNNHVVDKASKLKVTLSDGREYTAKVIGADPQTDVAVVKIDASDLPTLSFGNSSAARVGDLCFAIGNPFGQDHTVTMGIVSAKGRSLERGTYIQDFIQTDAAINPGNSGGALINARGELIGMNTMILTGGNSFGGEAGNVGIGFAVPSNMAKQVMDQIMKTGKVSRGYMGVTLESVTPELAPQFGLKDAKGALVGDLTPGAPGAKAGLKSGDVITAIDGKKVQGSDDLTMSVIAHQPGDTVTLDVMRDSKPMTVKVTLAQRPGGVDWDKNGPKGADNDGANGGDNDNDQNTTVRGMTVAQLTADVAQQVGISPATKGVVVTNVDADSPAADSVGKGSVIVAVDRHPVATIEEFKAQMAAAKDKPVLLTVNNGGSTGFVVVQPK
jgi:serine protease Do